METQVQFLLDRSQDFNEQKAKALDELTFAIKNNTAHVPALPFRANRPMRAGDYSRKITISGTTQIKWCHCAS